MALLGSLVCIFGFTLFSAQANQAEPIDFVVDIDGVLAYSMLDEKHQPPGATLIEAAGTVYRLTHGAPEFIEALHRIPGARVSFFSTALSARNVPFLKKLRLPGGKTAFQIGHKILSNEHLTKDGGLVRKDLVAAGFNPKRTVLFDDWVVNSAKGQEKSLLLITPAQPIFDPDLEMAVNIPDFEPAETAARDWALELTRERNKLIRGLGLLDEALEGSRKQQIEITDALYARQWQSSTNYNYEATNAEAVYARGERAFKTLGLNVQRYLDCEGLLTGLLR